MKKLLIALLTFSLMLGLIGCGAAPKQEEPAKPAEPVEEPVATPEVEMEPEEGDVATPMAYSILVKNENGEPVQGVTVQFCSETECMTGKTDADGVATFEKENGDYEIHILKVPDGYEKDETVYASVEPPAMTEITLVATPKEDENSFFVEQLGFGFTQPDKYKEAKGQIRFAQGGLLEDGIIQITNEYEAVDDEHVGAYYDWYEAMMDAAEKGEEPPEPQDPSWGTGRECAYLFEVYAIDGNHTKDDLMAAIKEYNPDRSTFSFFDELEKQGEWTFYLAQYKELEEKASEYEAAMGEFYEEFKDIASDKETFLSAIKLAEPTFKSNELHIGSQVKFVTEDFDGNEVNSEDLFLKADITMLNLWGTWCGPCRRELPEIAEIAKEYNTPKIQFVGVCNDADDEETIAEAKELLADAGAEYLNLKAFDGLDAALPTLSYPMTIFVDSEGKLVLEPIYGADVELYRTSIAEMLGETA